MPQPCVQLLCQPNSCRWTHKAIIPSTPSPFIRGSGSIICPAVAFEKAVFPLLPRLPCSSLCFCPLNFSHCWPSPALGLQRSAGGAFWQGCRLPEPDWTPSSCAPSELLTCTIVHILAWPDLIFKQTNQNYGSWNQLRPKRGGGNRVREEGEKAKVFLKKKKKARPVIKKRGGE